MLNSEKRQIRELWRCRGGAVDSVLAKMRNGWFDLNEFDLKSER